MERDLGQTEPALTKPDTQDVSNVVAEFEQGEPITDKESMYEFSRRIALKERNFEAEALARRELAQELVGRKPQIVTTDSRPGSVVQTRKGRRPEPDFEGIEDPISEDTGTPAEAKSANPRKVLGRSLTFGKKYTTTEQKVRAFEQIASEAGPSRNLRPRYLIEGVARRLGAPVSTIRAFWAGKTTKEQKKFLRFGDRAKYISIDAHPEAVSIDS